MTSFGISTAPAADDLDRAIGLVRIADEAERVTEAAVAAGRDPEDVRRIWNVMGAPPEPERFAAEVAPAVRDAIGDTT